MQVKLAQVEDAYDPRFNRPAPRLSILRRNGREQASEHATRLMSNKAPGIRHRPDPELFWLFEVSSLWKPVHSGDFK